MVAWWLRAVSVFNVICVVAWVAWAWPRSAWLAIAGIALFMLAGRLWLGLQFWIMQTYKRRLGLSVAARGAVLKAWNAETQESARQFAWQIPWREWAVPDHLPANAQGRRGVVLVHGWLCNRAVWTQTMLQLRAQNIPYVAVSLPMLLHRIATARLTLDAAVRHLHTATGVAPLLVGHSMGGLVLRDWLRSQPPAGELVPHVVITIGSPHHGSPMAMCAMGTNVKEMRPGSRWLAQLRSDEAEGGSAFSRVRWHCVYSDCDNVVFPESTSQLANAETHLLAGYAHVQMLVAPQLWALIESQLPAPVRR
ncbi:alpha/beta fold hydrolase [Diaphorobacter sp. HDW4A]|uniref:esterase/lipase family protein n=1 Tax=Diaphorobacter sp. HDW4A TaxID=2714924 RepID=UPI00140A3D87|nr:alpha/beta fold hydrolase [Diaphorobacter sp. HDW4A]QIL81893.1 alpha/beta fold hydrolase [Diaphorobacter sp. HDW4A]